MLLRFQVMQIDCQRGEQILLRAIRRDAPESWDCEIYDAGSPPEELVCINKEDPTKGVYATYHRREN
jgi:hypothetical protein